MRLTSAYNDEHPLNNICNKSVNILNGEIDAIGFVSSEIFLAGGNWRGKLRFGAPLTTSPNPSAKASRCTSLEY